MKDDPWKYLPTLLLGIVFIVWGIIMLANNWIGVGTHYLTGQHTTGGGYLFILIGIIFLIVTYFNLSPFSKIRKFIEGSSKKRGQQS